MSHKMAQRLGQNVIGRLVKGKAEEQQKIVLAAYSGVSEYGAILPYSRKHELEADAIGLMLMAEAGYDPSVAPEFWERFAQLKSGGSPVEFVSTHPSDARRSAALRERLPEAMQVYEASPEKTGLGNAISD